jgi:hypothetical protein
MDVALFSRFTQRWRAIREDLRTYMTKAKPKAA